MEHEPRIEAEVEGGRDPDGGQLAGEEGTLQVGIDDADASAGGEREAGRQHQVMQEEIEEDGHRSGDVEPDPQLAPNGQGGPERNDEEHVVLVHLRRQHEEGEGYGRGEEQDLGFVPASALPPLSPGTLQDRDIGEGKEGERHLGGSDRTEPRGLRVSPWSQQPPEIVGVGRGVGHDPDVPEHPAEHGRSVT